MNRRIIMIVVGGLWMLIGRELTNVTHLSTGGAYFLGAFFGAVLFEIYGFIDARFYE